MAQCRIRVLASASLIRMQGVTTPPSTGREAVQGRRQQFCASKITQLALTCARPGDHLRHGVGSQAHGLSVEMGGAWYWGGRPCMRPTSRLFPSQLFAVADTDP